MSIFMVPYRAIQAAIETLGNAMEDVDDRQAVLERAVKCGGFSQEWNDGREVFEFELRLTIKPLGKLSCVRCGGSGDGQTEHSLCVACKGTGEVQ